MRLIQHYPEATKDWYLTAPSVDAFYGTGVQRAYDEFLSKKKPAKEIIVAIIDSGTDIEHEDLATNIWINEDEIKDNGIDDDKNGYVDDIHGWNFIGGADGNHVRDDTYELTRIYASLRDDYLGINPEKLDPEEYQYFMEIKEAFEARKQENDQILANLKNINQAILGTKQILGVSSMDSLTSEQIALKKKRMILIYSKPKI